MNKTGGKPSESRGENKFSKEQLLLSKQFQDKKDVVNALLSNEGMYSTEAVEKMIEKYMKGQVK